MLRLLGVLRSPEKAHFISRQVIFLLRVLALLRAFELPFRFPFTVVTVVIGPPALALFFVLQLSSGVASVAVSLLFELVVRFSLVVAYQVGVLMLRLHAAAATVVSLFSSLMRFIFFLLVVPLLPAWLGRHCFLHS